MSPIRADTERVAIQNKAGDLAILREALDRFCVRHAVDRKSHVQLQVVLDELVSNVIKYSWPDGGTHEIRLRISALADGIELEIVDDGRAFDPRTAPTPPTRAAGDRPRPGGVGIHIVKQLVDRIEYVRTGGLNYTTLTKQCTVVAPPEGT